MVGTEVSRALPSGALTAIKELREALKDAHRSLEELSRCLGVDLSPVVTPRSRGSNAARRQMVRQLKGGIKRGQSVEILKLLAKTNTPLTMPAITKYMQQHGYHNNRFYDPSNALVDVGFAESRSIAGQRAWTITPAGAQFLEEEH